MPRLGLGPGEASPHISTAWPSLAQRQPQGGHMCYPVAQLGHAGLFLFTGEVSPMGTCPGEWEVFALPPLTPNHGPRGKGHGTHLLAVRAGEVVSGGLQVVFQGLGG